MKSALETHKELLAIKQKNKRLKIRNKLLLDALIELKERIEKCLDDPIEVSEMYDSFYRELVESAIQNAESLDTLNEIEE